MISEEYNWRNISSALQWENKFGKQSASIFLYLTTPYNLQINCTIN
jgi:hypothetical protein